MLSSGCLLRCDIDCRLLLKERWLTHTNIHILPSYMHTHTQLKHCLIFLFSVECSPSHFHCTHTQTFTYLPFTYIYTHIELKCSHYQFAITPTFLFIYHSFLSHSYVVTGKNTRVLL
ncbi:Hypothetical predicted protein [Octopus vulgaris]|uniref:Uncharacterized protein n=1 Tax=Octopus vulgaris TaxID=6645 RepID=A0AA36F5S0_OCTVU|nr:Hypothetical predicted protein [Octopus vulgaris]